MDYANPMPKMAVRVGLPTQHAISNPFWISLHDMEDQCPDALFINFSNPMARICAAIHRYQQIRVAGAYVTNSVQPMPWWLKRWHADLGDRPGHDFLSTHAGKRTLNPCPAWDILGYERLKILAAGINHFTWMLGNPRPANR